MIAKAAHSDQGANPRFVVTSLKGDAQAIYEEIYCARGEIENRIKEQQLGLFADLAGSELARAQVNTIRLKLLKIGTVILRNARRIRLLFSSAYPQQELFAALLRQLSSA